MDTLGYREKYQSHDQGVEHHSTEKGGGIKRIDALGALKLLSGGTASLASVDDLHQATGRDYNLVVGKKHNATVGGDMQEKIAGLRKSVAGQSQRLVAPKNHVGSEEVNIFRVLCDTLDLLEQMASQIASHVHGSSPIPTTAGAFSADAAKAALLSAELGTVTS